MDGAELLGAARDIRPGMARIVLSGYTEREIAIRSAALAHQFIAKPCSADTLKTTVSRACDLRALLDEVGLADTVCRLGTLPSLPSLYRAITAAIDCDELSLEHVADIVSKDIAMTAKVLQLVNSSFFGLGKRVLDIHEGIGYLGADVIRALVASNGAFSEFESEPTASLEAFWQHSAFTGLLAGRIVEMEVGTDRLMRGEAVQAGMLHDVGQLALAARLPSEFRSSRDSYAAVSLPQRARIGCNHDRVGAYLMGLWGLSDRIVEAIAYHHHPRECAYSNWSPLTAVHAADALVNEQLGTGDSELDSAYLASVGCGRRVDLWRREAEQVVSSAGETFAVATSSGLL
jgi:HD-like signal output (HDOD) protein